MTSLATSSDRTLFFDFFPLEAVAIRGFKTKFALFTVPGQVIYNATRQIVLRGVDGIVFVADSQYDKMEENGRDLQTSRGQLEDHSISTSTTSLTSCSTTSATCRMPPRWIIIEYVLNNRDSSGALVRGLGRELPTAYLKR